MSLQVLSDVGPEIAGRLLAAAAIATAPNPWPERQPQTQEAELRVNELLGEIRSVLGLRVDDSSAQAKSLIEKFIGKEIEKTFLSGKSRDDTLLRAAQSGQLSPSVYRVVEPQTFKDTFYRFGLKKHVETAVLQPDDVQHLMTEDVPVGEREDVSLFMKLLPERGGREGCWLIVQTLRQGLKQIVQSAFRIYPSDVNLIGAQEPIDALRAFTEVFGSNVSVGGVTGKLIVSVSLLKTPTMDQTQPAMKILDIVPDHFMSFTWRSTSSPLFYRIGMAYCINMAKYKLAMKKHGF